MKNLTNQPYVSNHFVLLSSHEDQPAWEYTKAFPVPIVEATVRAGPAELPTYKSAYGRLGGAVCFDFDHPKYLIQSSQKEVDILLQPSQTWGAVISRHFEGNALRATENGASMFRCSCDGESGIVNARGKIISRAYTGHDPKIPVLFTLPLHKRVLTIYADRGGYMFEYIILALGILIYTMILIPDKILDWMYTATLGRIVGTSYGRGSDRGRAVCRSLSEESQSLVGEGGARGGEGYNGLGTIREEA